MEGVREVEAVEVASHPEGRNSSSSSSEAASSAAVVVGSMAVVGGWGVGGLGGGDLEGRGRPELGPGESCLDMGSGKGEFAMLVEERGGDLRHG